MFWADYRPVGDVRPLTGARIETFDSGVAPRRLLVRPLTGARIETRNTAKSWWIGSRVRPLTGARIETIWSRRERDFCLVRPLTGARIETFMGLSSSQ